MHFVKYQASVVKVLFRVDASPRIGLGHLQRSLSLALALNNLSADCLFLTNNASSNRARIESHGFAENVLPQVQSWTPEDLKSTLYVAESNKCQTILVDSHEVRTDYLDKLRSTGLFVIVRDDLALHSFSCQLVINGNADAGLLPYRSSSGDTRFLLGPRYAVLRPEYQELPARSTSAVVHNVLVILGGADSKNLMPGILNLLGEIPDDFGVTAVVGPFFGNLAHIQSAVENAKRPISLIYDPDSVKDLMLEAELAISAAGQTLYELACTGCPTIAIKVASNQEGQMGSIANAGSIQAVCGESIAEIVTNLKINLATLLADENARRKMAEMGQRMVDGKGGPRVAQKICSLAY